MASIENQLNPGYLYFNKTVFLVMALIGCLTMFKFAFLLQKWGRLKFLRLVGFHSIQIYVMHVIVTAFVRTFLHRVLHINNAVLLLAIGISVGVIIPILVYNYLIKDGPLWFLFTYKRPVKEKLQPQITELRSVTVTPQPALRD